MKTKKLLAFLLSAAMIFTLLPIGNVFAETPENWTDGLTSAPEGYSEVDDVITVTTPQALAWISVQANGLNEVTVSNFSGKTVELGADIDLSGKNWTPIGYSGSSKNAFKGNFDGKNYTISNMTIDSDAKAVGLFGYIASGGTKENPVVVKNIKLTNVDITVDASKTRLVGALAGQHTGSYGNLENCSATGTITCGGASATKSINAGGLIGSITPLTNPTTPPAAVIKKCTADVDISGKGTVVGGFAASLQSNGEVIECGASGDINVADTTLEASAGFIGEIESYNGSAAVKKCYSTGNVKAEASAVAIEAGGFIGGNINSGNSVVIEECMSTSDVIVNNERSGGAAYAGGFIGAALSNVSISDCYCTGDVEAANGSYVLGGGFGGHLASKTASCYASGSVLAEEASNSNRAYAFAANLGDGVEIKNSFALAESITGLATSRFISTSYDYTFENCGYYGDMEVNLSAPSQNGIELKSLTENDITAVSTYEVFSSEKWDKAEGKLPTLVNIPDTVENVKKPAYLYKKAVTITSDMPKRLVYNGTDITELFAIDKFSATADGQTVNVKYVDYRFEFYKLTDEGGVVSKTLVDKPNDYGSYIAVVTVPSQNEAYKGKTTISFTVGKPISNEFSVTAPVSKEEAQTSIDAGEYTANIVWSPEIAEGEKFKGNTEYTATITLTANDEYAFDAGAEFEIDGADSVTVKSNDGEKVVIEAVFPKTKGGKTAIAAGTVVGGGKVTKKDDKTDDEDNNVNDEKNDEVQEPIDDNNEEQKPNGGNNENPPAEDENKAPFGDVNEGDWFYDSVMYAYENGLMNGISEKTFAPNDNVTRAMFVTVLYRAEGEPAVNRSIPFADVKADAYYANAVIWAHQNGIVTGITENEFAPDENITREQIATILYRYAKYKGIDVGEGGMKIREFEDYDNISEYALNAITWTVNAGLLNGKSETTLAPEDNATRAEFATILQRFTSSNE